MIVRQFKEDITIIPISDVHLGARECMEQEFMKFIDEVKDKPNVYLILGGDMINNSTRSSVSNIFEETMRPADQKKMMAKILEPVRDKILCSVTGNHERRSGKDADDDPMYDIMCKLDIEDRHRENMAFVNITLCNRETDYVVRGKFRPSYTLVVTHGTGGGRMTSGAVLAGERFAYVVDCDALIVGHTHKPFTTVSGRIHIDTHVKKVSVLPFHVVSMTSWMEYGSYAMAKMLMPSAHCLHQIKLCADHKEITVIM